MLILENNAQSPCMRTASPPCSSPHRLQHVSLYLTCYWIPWIPLYTVLDIQTTKKKAAHYALLGGEIRAFAAQGSTVTSASVIAGTLYYSFQRSKEATDCVCEGLFAQLCSFEISVFAISTASLRRAANDTRLSVLAWERFQPGKYTMVVEEGHIIAPIPRAHLNRATRLFGKAFRAGVPLRRIFDETQVLFGDVAWKTAAAQRALLQETVLYQTDRARNVPDFGFGQSRCARFLRLLMDEVDRCSKGDVDELVSELASQYCMRKPFTQTGVHVVHDMPNGEEVILLVSNRFNDIGLRVWEAGLCLCSQLFEAHSALRNDVKGATVLELGAGTGVSGPAYVTAGAKRVWLTDYKHEVIDRINENLRNNNVPDMVQTALLDASDLSRLRNFVIDFDVDVIIAADVTYDIDLVEIMVRAFSDSITGDLVGYLLATDRNPETTSFMRQELLSTGLIIQNIDMNETRQYPDQLLGSTSCEICTLKLIHSGVR